MILQIFSAPDEFAYSGYDLQYDKIIQSAKEAFSSYENFNLVWSLSEFRYLEADDNFATAMEAVKSLTKRIPSHIPDRT